MKKERVNYNIIAKSPKPRAKCQTRDQSRLPNWFTITAQRAEILRGEGREQPQGNLHKSQIGACLGGCLHFPGHAAFGQPKQNKPEVDTF